MAKLATKRYNEMLRYSTRVNKRNYSFAGLTQKQKEDLYMKVRRQYNRQAKIAKEKYDIEGVYFPTAREFKAWGAGFDNVKIKKEHIMDVLEATEKIREKTTNDAKQIRKVIAHLRSLENAYGINGRSKSGQYRSLAAAKAEDLRKRLEEVANRPEGDITKRYVANNIRNNWDKLKDQVDEYIRDSNQGFDINNALKNLDSYIDLLETLFPQDDAALENYRTANLYYQVMREIMYGN